MGKLLGGLGKGMSLLTLDAGYQRARAREKMKRAETVGEGAYMGAKEFGSNIVAGITGIVRNPYQGWRQDGASGMASGVAKGLLGVAFKPAVGVFDLASRAAEGIRNATLRDRDSGRDAQGGALLRSRMPRTFGRNGQIERCQCSPIHSSPVTWRADAPTHQCARTPRASTPLPHSSLLFLDPRSNITF